MYKTFLLIMILLVLGACSPSSKTIEEPITYTPVKGLLLDTTDDPTIVYRRSGAPTLAAYHEFIIDPVLVDYDDPDIKEIAPEDLNKLSIYFQQALRRELLSSGYKVTTRSGPNTLRMSFVIRDIKADIMGGAANVAVMATGAVLGIPGFIAVDTGEITVEATFRESASNRIDAVVIARSSGSRFFNNKPWSTWQDVEDSLDLWAEGIRTAVDKAHGKKK